VSYVKTPSGVIMDADDHARAVVLAAGHKSLLSMLIPIEPCSVSFPTPPLVEDEPYRALVKVDLPPSHWDFCDYLNDFTSDCYLRFGRRVVTAVEVDEEFALSHFGIVLKESTGFFTDTFQVRTSVGPITVRVSKRK
jgi:hypothetical protein